VATAPPPVVGYLLFGDPAGAILPDAVDAPEPAAFLDALGAHSPTVEPDPPAGCWLDLRAGKRAPALATRARALRDTADDWGHPSARLGIAPTPGVARLAAYHGADTCTILPTAEQVADFLAPLPLGGVGLGAAHVERLALVGLRILGDVAALRRGALGDYLGVAGPALEALARGADDRSLVPIRPPLVLTARRELDWALADRAQLAHLVDALLAPLLGQLRRQGLGVTRAALLLGNGTAKPQRHALTLGRPTTTGGLLRDGLLTLLPETNAAEGAEGAAITVITMELTAPRPLIGRQASFFDVPQGRAGRLHAGLREARRRSDAALGHLRLADPTHPLPERRYALAKLVLEGDEEAAR
jgi:nucleotidyltransferase/DNA polymerase involved in DNA repair